LKIFLDKMSYADVEERLKQGYDMAIVPTGSMEQHGSHLPLDTDIFNCYEIVKRAAMKVADEVKPVVAPPLYYGYSWPSMDFPGSITLREEIFVEVVTDICKSLIHHGFKKIVVVNGHRGNMSPLHAVRYKVKTHTSAFIAVLFYYTFIEKLVKQMIELPDEHAGDWETSIYLALDENCVNMKKAVNDVPKFPFDRSLFPLRFKEWSKSGVFGYANMASKEKGEKLIQAAVDGLAEFLRKFKDFGWKETLKNKYTH